MPENPEKRDCRIEEEGNLGRTDLIVTAGIGRRVPQVELFGIRLAVPIETWQRVSRYPPIVSLGWTH